MSQPPYGSPPQGNPLAGSAPAFYPPPNGGPLTAAAPDHGFYPGPAHTPEPPKKPFFKRPWFIVVVALVILGAIGSALQGKDPKTSPAASSASPSVPVQSTVAPPTTPAPVAPSPVVAAPTTSASVPTTVNFVMPSSVGLDL